MCVHQSVLKSVCRKLNGYKLVFALWALAIIALARR